jgi:hypothetical protein
MSDQLLVIVVARFLPSSVNGGSRPFEGSTTREVSRFASPTSAHAPARRILLAAMSACRFANS